MNLSRRFFLKSVSGATLALPALPSLLGSRVAEANPLAGPKCFAFMRTSHGGVWPENLYPADSLAVAETQTYGGHEIRRRAVNLNVANGVASLSPVLSAPASHFTPGLAAKMNLLRGIDFPIYMAHHPAGNLGNFLRPSVDADNAAPAGTIHATPTIDQLIGWSSSFYPDMSVVQERVLVLGESGVSSVWAAPDTRTGGIVNAALTASSSAHLFNRLFPTGQGPAANVSLVDAVLADFNRLKSSAKLSNEDKTRLDMHLQQVDELERKLRVNVSCPVTPVEDNAPIRAPGSYPDDPVAQSGYQQLNNQVIALAFSCGVSRIMVMYEPDTFSTYSASNYHADVAHQSYTTPARQQLHAQAHQQFFSGAFLDLAERLDAISIGGGATLLDRSLVCWSHESGPTTHNNDSTPYFTFGGAGGALKTGVYADYRNLTVRYDGSHPNQPVHPGVLVHQWTGTVLRAFGIPESEWRPAGAIGGYPNITWVRVPNVLTPSYDQAAFDRTGEMLPFLV
jgi:hypothetical protein